MAAISNNNSYADKESTITIMNLDEFLDALTPYISALKECRVSNKARLAFINIFFSGLIPSTQSLSGKTKEFILSIPESDRTLPSVCQKLYEKKIFSRIF